MQNLYNDLGTNHCTKNLLRIEKYLADLITITEEICNGKLHFFVQWIDHTGQYTKWSFLFSYFFLFCEQIPNFLRICSHCLKKSLMERFIFSAVGMSVVSIWFQRNQPISTDSTDQKTMQNLSLFGRVWKKGRCSKRSCNIHKTSEKSSGHLMTCKSDRIFAENRRARNSVLCRYFPSFLKLRSSISKRRL